VSADAAFTYARSFLRVLADSNQSNDLLVCEEISSVDRYETFVPMMQQTAEGRAILQERPTISRSSTDYGALRSLPEGSLGRSYADHMERLQLEPDLLAGTVTRGRSDEANFLLERGRQTHDIWHVAVGLGAAPYEEVLLQAFQWAQLHTLHSALIVSLGSIKHLIAERRWPMLRHALLAGSRAGRRSEPLLRVFWERHWHEPLHELRARLGIVPASEWRGVSSIATP